MQRMAFSISLLVGMSIAVPSAIAEQPAGYQPLEPFFCDVQARDATVDSAGNIPDASGIQLKCAGKSVALVDEKISNGWLETKEFGKIWISRSGVFVTPEQSGNLHKTFR